MDSHVSNTGTAYFGYDNRKCLLDMSSSCPKSAIAANLPRPTGSSHMDALTSFGLPIHSLSVGIAPSRDRCPMGSSLPTSDSSVLFRWLICLLPGTVFSGRCPRSQRLVVRVHRFEVQHRSGKFICVTAAQLPAKSLDMGVGRLGCSPDQPSEAAGLARWSENRPTEAPCQGNRR